MLKWIIWNSRCLWRGWIYICVSRNIWDRVSYSSSGTVLSRSSQLSVLSSSVLYLISGVSHRRYNMNFLAHSPPRRTWSRSHWLPILETPRPLCSIPQYRRGKRSILGFLFGLDTSRLLFYWNGNRGCRIILGYLPCFCFMTFPLDCCWRSQEPEAKYS